MVGENITDFGGLLSLAAELSARSRDVRAEGPHRDADSLLGAFALVQGAIIMRERRAA